MHIKLSKEENKISKLEKSQCFNIEHSKKILKEKGLFISKVEWRYLDVKQSQLEVEFNSNLNPVLTNTVV